MAGTLLTRASIIFFGILFFYLLSSTAQGLSIEGGEGVYTSPEEWEEMMEQFRKEDEKMANMTEEERVKYDEERDRRTREIEERDEAQHKLFDYISSMRLMIGNRKNKLVAEERVKLCAAIDIADVWFYEHLNAKIDKNEYLLKLKEAEDACNPIIKASLENRPV